MKNTHLTIRIDDELLENIDKIVKYRYLDKSAVVRQVLRIGIEQELKELAIKLYADGELTTSGGAKFCDMYIGDFMELLAKRGVPNDIPEEILKHMRENHFLLPNKQILASPKQKIKYSAQAPKQKKKIRSK